MWRRFWFKDDLAGTGASYGPEVLHANWIPPQAEVGVTADAPEAAQEETPDIGAFLARVYVHQEC
jgi:hypothetical protein